MTDTRSLWWTVALESALFFSVPTWVLTDGGWPVNGPLRFSMIVVSGSFAAMLLCHILPAACAPMFSIPLARRAGAIPRIILGLCFCVGAAISLGQMSRLSGSKFVVWQDGAWANRPLLSVVAVLVAFVGVLLALVLAWNERWQRPLIAMCFAAGMFLVLGGFFSGLPAIHMKNAQLISEAELGDLGAVFKGMLMAAAPAAVLGLRVGELRLASRKLWLTGFFGVWLPLSLSVALVSLGKVWGMRLYWKPSVPIEFHFAFLWLAQGSANNIGIARALWPMGLTLFIPCLIGAIWIRDMTAGWNINWRKFTLAVAIAIAYVVLLSAPAWALYFFWWPLSILIVAPTAAFFGWFRRSGR